MKAYQEKESINITVEDDIDRRKKEEQQNVGNH
jgi:hypothetical protein